jgi:hypothetical protein
VVGGAAAAVVAVCFGCRVLWSFKLNPYERLNLRFTATPEEVRRQYRKLSLMVHPDKCKHAQAAEAFDSECTQQQLSVGARGVGCVRTAFSFHASCFDLMALCCSSSRPIAANQ